MRKLILTMLLTATLCMPCGAVNLPNEVSEYLPAGAEEAVEAGLLTDAVHALWNDICAALNAVLRRGLRGAVRLALTLLLCGAAEGLCAAGGGTRYVSLFGALSLVSLSAGELDEFIGMGVETIEALGTLSKALLPTVAAAMAASGRINTAGVWQVGTIFACDLLLSAAQGLLLPLVYCFIGTATAGALLPESGLDRLAVALRKCVSGALCGGMLVFTAYLSVSGVLSGTADKAAVRVTKAAVSHAVPVVGDILADASEVLLSGADTLRGTVGTLGILAVLGACAVPLARLGLQYVCYRAAAFVGTLAGVRRLDTLVERLGEAFALVLGLTGAAALILCVALLLALTVTTL